MFKKYRIRPYSPLWYIINVGRIVLGAVMFFICFMGALWACGGM